MTKLSSQIRIEAPAEQVWAALANLEAVQDYSAGVAKARYTSDVREGIGARRHCDLQNPSGWVEERVTDWQDGREMTIEIYESNAPLKSAFGRFAVTPDGEATTVDFALDYEMKFGPIGALMSLLPVKRVFGKANKSTLAGLKYYVETGEVVGTDIPVAAATPA